MTVDFGPIPGHAPDLRGLGGGEGIGLQVQFPGRNFGLIIPAWFAAPFGFKGIGGIWTEVTHEAYDLVPAGRLARARPNISGAMPTAWRGARRSTRQPSYRAAVRVLSAVIALALAAGPRACRARRAPSAIAARTIGSWRATRRCAHRRGRSRCGARTSMCPARAAMHASPSARRWHSSRRIPRSAPAGRSPSRATS